MKGTKKRNVLGRGLDALIPGGVPDAVVSAGATEVDIDRITPNPHQPRDIFEPDALDALAGSIRENGIIQPLVLRPRGEDFEIVAGERRWRAAQLAGLRRVPAVIKNVADDDLLAVALIENIQRQDLSSLETAKAFRLLVDEHRMTQEQVATRVGMQRSSIANYLRLLSLADEPRRALERGEIEMGHARALAGLDDPAKQAEACREITRKGLSVRQAEGLVQHLKEPRPQSAGKSERRDADVAAAEKRLQGVLGTRVRIVRNTRGAGRIEVQFRSDEELDRLFSFIVDDLQASGPQAISG